MKRILITGKNSYIGTSFKNWVMRFPNEYRVDSVSVRTDDWKDLDFSKYDVVLNVAGIAHIRITPELEDEFYRVNRDLAIDICRKAKESGVGQYIYLSSMNVYGDINEVITADTKPNPKNFYGMSKLQADEEIQKMNDDNFLAVSIRPPVVYGKGCKGNFAKLEKYSKMLPFFPEYKNIRSMIYVDNLSELIKLTIDNSQAFFAKPGGSK